MTKFWHVSYYLRWRRSRSISSKIRLVLGIISAFYFWGNYAEVSSMCTICIYVCVPYVYMYVYRMYICMYICMCMALCRLPFDLGLRIFQLMYS
jgi:hypothetical protein